MGDHSWIYRDSFEGFYRQDYLKRIEVLINFILSNPKNISRGKIICPCAKCKNKKFHHKNVLTMHILKKGFIEK
jgi:hypothetical protein